MRIREIRTLAGPNLHHEAPVLAMDLEPGAPANGTPADSPDSHHKMMRRLLALFPELEDLAHAPCGWARCVERVAEALCERSGIARRTEKRAAPRPGDSQRVILPYLCESSATHLLHAAVDCIVSLREGRDFEVEGAVAQAQKIFARRPISLSTRAMLRIAESRRIPWMALHHRNLIQLGYGKNRRLIQATRTDGTSLIAGDMAANKQFSKEVLESALIPVPRGASVSTIESALEACRALEPPWVVKPRDGHQGHGITMGVRDEESLAKAFRFAREHSEQVLIEETFEGIDFRALVIDGKLVAVCRMIPAHVTGDGIHTVQELVALENLNPLRGDSHSFPLMRLKLGPEELRFLREHSREPGQIPAKGAFVALRKNANGSAGGSPLDVTVQVHPEIRALCERTARVIGLDVCGIDLIVKDISRPIERGDRCGIIEINSRPGLHGHLRPGELEPCEAASRVIEMLFPRGRPSRIPIVAFCGPPRSLAYSRSIEGALLKSGLATGRAGPDGVFLGGTRVIEAGVAQPAAIRAVLMDPKVEFALFDLDLKAVEREGLGFEGPDVAVMLGAGGSPDALRLLLESVIPGGTVLVNDADPEVMEMLRSSRIPPDRETAFLRTEEARPSG